MVGRKAALGGISWYIPAERQCEFETGRYEPVLCPLAFRICPRLFRVNAIESHL